MHTIISSKEFQKKAKNKFTSIEIEQIIENLSIDPKLGKKFKLVNNIYKVNLGLTENKKQDYNLVYCYQGKNTPVFLINIFKVKEKDLITKIISCLIAETLEK